MNKPTAAAFNFAMMSMNMQMCNRTPVVSCCLLPKPLQVPAG